MNNNALAALAQKAGPSVLNAIKSASAKTGVDFAYLLEKAAAESSFNAEAKAKTSSATGLYQFIESTWMDMVKKHGHKFGLDKMAAHIDENGQVTDKAVKNEILALRKDPKAAAFMAAQFAADNKAHLERHVGGEIGATELYFAHFLGASGASGFLNAMRENPMQTAADVFPAAAKANHNVFYDRKTGEARTLAGVYEFFDKKFEGSEKDGNAAAPVRKTVNAGHTLPLKGYKPMMYRSVGTNINLQDILLDTVLKSDTGNTERRASWPGFTEQNFGGFMQGPELLLMAQMSL